MYNINVKISEIPIKILFDEPEIISKYEDFIFSGDICEDITLNIKSCSSIKEPEGKVILNEYYKWVKGSGKKNYLSILVYALKSKTIISLLQVNNSWTNANMFYLKKHLNPNKYLYPTLFNEILFSNRLLFHRGIIIHASAVKWKNKGIIFSAPSDTGKSTMAGLWRDFMGASILNGDRPALRFFNDSVKIYGTPWSGNPPEHLNDSANLNAIVILEQSKENSLYRIEGNEIINQLMPRCFLPYHDEELMKMAISNLEQIISNVPVYLLHCRPDYEAVELVYKCIK